MHTLYIVDTVDRFIKALQTIQSDVDKHAGGSIEIKLEIAPTAEEQDIIEVEYDGESNTVILR